MGNGVVGSSGVRISKDFGFGVNLPHVEGSDALRHFGRANVSYLARVGNGVTIQARLFNSFIGYESLYAKDNFNYTRAWIADYSPYLMFGANAQYVFNEQWSGTFFVINEYFHLQNANSLPSYGMQVAINPAHPGRSSKPSITVPISRTRRSNFVAIFSDTIVEWKAEDVTIAFDYQIGTQKTAEAPGEPRTFCTGAALPMRWHIAGTVERRPATGVLLGSERPSDGI